MTYETISAAEFVVLQERKPRPLAGARELLEAIAAHRGEGVLVKATPAREPKEQRGELAGIVRGYNIRWRREGFEADHGPLAWAIRRGADVRVYAMAGGPEVGALLGDEGSKRRSTTRGARGSTSTGVTGEGVFVDRDVWIVDGHHRAAAAAERGEALIEVAATHSGQFHASDSVASNEGEEPEAEPMTERELDESPLEGEPAPITARPGGPRECTRGSCTGLVVFPAGGGPARCDRCGMRPAGRPTTYERSRS